MHERGNRTDPTSLAAEETETLLDRWFVDVLDERGQTTIVTLDDLRLHAHRLFVGRHLCIEPRPRRNNLAVHGQRLVEALRK